MAARGVATILVLSALVGCKVGNGDRRPIYTGPTEPMSAVVEQINANNARVPTLWAKGYYEANIVDGRRKDFINGDISLLYRRPTDLRLVARKDVAGEVFVVGSNAERYWLIVKGGVDKMWRGARGASSTIDPPKDMPIQPQLMLEVLGVNTIDANFTAPPVPVMRFNNDADAYMFVWNLPVPGRWVAQKEVWYDRATKLPVKVVLFDANGRVVLRANLSNHKPVSGEGDGYGTDAPKVATGYKLYFPDSGTTLSIDLSEVLLRRGDFPKDISFAFPRDPGVSQIIDVDAEPSQNAPPPQ